jgi:hypothetical protein
MRVSTRLFRGRPMGRSMRALSLAPVAALAVGLLAGPTAVAHAPQTHAQPESAAARQATVQKVKVDPRLFGVHDAHLTSLTKPTTGSIRLWDTGTSWSTMQPTADGPISWARLDQIVADAWANGTEVTFVVAMTPTWAAAPGSSLTDGTEPPDPAAYAAFLKTLMQRYQDYDGSGRPGIANYQLWNEANITTFWSGTPQQMADLVKTAYDVRAQTDPSVKLIAPAQVSSRPWMMQWTKTFYGLTTPAVGGQPVWKYVDAISLQLYPVDLITMSDGTTRPGTPEDSIALLARVRGYLAKDGVPSTVPIWNTEINYGLRFGDLRGTSAAPIPDALQVAYVIRTFLLNAATGVKRVYWYTYDMGNLPPDKGGTPLANTVLTDPNNLSAGTLTPAGRAVARVESWMNGKLVGTTTQPPCLLDSHGTYTCKVKYATGVGRIYWNPYATAKVTLVSSAKKRVDEYGVKSAVHGGTKMKVDYRPVLVKSRR